ncbi:phosphoribosyltransferase family protein [Actinophytocola sp.]|uniref:phosphoribosyltransferase family protein n=1 Tax=Actinophytocola sp. TaxID=1872138 RepID=UPI0025C283D9|nr:phosphoribosyltransferase family protein [Actinophytocola sp.]
MLAAAVARRLDKRLVRCAALADFRTPAKSLDPAGRASVIDNQFVCREDLSGLSLLIVDDVYGSGSTVAETARAVRAAGAVQVASLCAVRTMRF